MSKFYITTTIPYVNADPHVGFALEIVQADVLSRWKRQELGSENVFFNTGTDEHGAKVYQKALEKGEDIKSYCDGCSECFQESKVILNLSYDNFIRTTDPHHMEAVQEFWRRSLANGDIYKKNYKIKYCVGCELERTDSELVEGKCILHPNGEIEIIEEENYFFKLSKYQTALLDLYKNQPELVVPDFRFNEVKKFVERGLHDFSISRLKSKMPWGVPVPSDETQVMYVWFDALVNYISAIGWPDDEENFNKWWPVVQFAGKDQLKTQVIMWQAMLMSVELPSSKQIVIHGFINSGGQKMSKSLGNVINPFVVVKEYGTDALRYYLTREVNPFEDSDFTMERFKEVYNANLANGLGNLVARIMKMSETYLESAELGSLASKWEQGFQASEEYKNLINNYEFNKAMDLIWEGIAKLDLKIQETEPFKLIKTDEVKAKEILKELAQGLHTTAQLLEPFMPETSAKIKEAIKTNKMPKALFLRKE